MATPASALILTKFRGCSAEGGREIDRQRETDSQTETGRQTETDRQTDTTQTDRQAKTGRQTEAESERFNKHSELCLPVDYILQAFWGNA